MAKMAMTYSLDEDMVRKIQEEWVIWQYRNMSDMANALLNIGYKVIKLKKEWSENNDNNPVLEQTPKSEGVTGAHQEQNA